MVVTLKNENFELDVNTHGAEINRFVRPETGRDIIWCGDSSVWKFHVPVLFPHCGKIKDAFVLIDGKSFPYVMIWLNAGASEFVCIEPWFGLSDADNTNH